MSQALLALLALVSFSSCATLKTTLEAKPVAPSEFLDPSHGMEKMGPRSPFLKTWTSASQSQRLGSAGKTEIYIAPVETRFLRPIQAKLAGGHYRRWHRERPVDRIASTIREEFAKAFENSKEPRYRVVDRPTANSVMLELALIELDPSSISGNMVRKAATLAVGPAPALASILTNGHIAIEGRLIDSTKGWSLFEFADNEKDKMTFWTLRDFRPYGHSKVAIREWARQFEEMTRNPDWAEMGDARIWTLRPW